jgi:predicted ester cyclase
MSMTQHRRLVRRFFNADPKAQLLVLTENNFTRDFVCHSPEGDLDRFGFKNSIEELAGAFPDLHYDIDEITTEGEDVVVRWTLHGIQRDRYHEIPPTNEEVSLSGITVERFRGNKIAETWQHYDPLSIETQLKQHRISA